MPEGQDLGLSGLIEDLGQGCADRPNYSEATVRGNIVPPHCFIDMFLLLLLQDLHSLTIPWEILSGDNIAEKDYCGERRV